MSVLREQLNEMRATYAARMYPGDLAAKLLSDGVITRGARWSTRTRLLVAWTSGAIAASVSLAVLVYEPAANAVQNSVQHIAQSANRLPFMNEISPGSGSSHEDDFSIVPEFHALDIPLPPTPALSGGEVAFAAQEPA